MDRTRGKANENIRLFQRLDSAGTITIYQQNETIVVDAAVPTQFLSTDLYYYMFAVGDKKVYIISWDTAPAARRWQILDIDTGNLDEIQPIIEEINAETPAAEVG